MRQTLQVLGLGCLLALGLGQARPAHALCEVPLVISHGSNDANVLMIIDNSQSMNEAMVSDSYNPATKYTGSFSSTSTYNVSTSGNYTPKNFKSTWAATPTAYLVTSDGGQQSSYDGNYLNWVYFNATAAQRAAIPTMTRIQTVKAAVNTVLSTSSNCVFGLMTFNSKSTGGHLLAPMGTALATLQTQVNSIVATTSTPLARTLDSALVYFQTTGVGAPITAACEKSFIVLATDGLPTNDSPIPAFLNDYDGDGKKGQVDDVSAYLYRNDLRPDLAGIQNVATFVIGCNINAPILQDTADNGGGEYYSANNAAAIGAAVSQAFNAIQKRISAGAAVAVVSAEDRSNNRLYRARYESQSWRGFVEAFTLPYHSGDVALWEAGQLLSSTSTSARTIRTSIAGATMLDFSATNAAVLMTSLAAPGLSQAQDIINYTRGDAVGGYRDRAGWVLGDIVDASPVVVGRPSTYSTLPGYAAFRSTYSSRTEVVYVGANDGMLHCFNATDGTEMWAYVPRDLLPRLQDLMSTTYCHEYFVNLTPAVYDVYSGNAWKTILVGGEERGGNGLFAIDVTTPEANTMNLLWDVDLTALKGSWNPPSLIRDRNRNAHVFCVGTGYDPASSVASLLVIDPILGTVLSTFTLGTAIAGNKTTRATAIDLDFDGFDDLLYLGDLAGRIWRVDLRTNPWTVSQLINVGKPIQAAPSVTVDALGHPMVFFGTGQYLTDTDVTNTTTQSIYGVIDNNSGTTVALTDLVDQTSTFHALVSSSRGWFINLVQAPGERSIRSPALINGTLYVPSFLPNTTACAGGGQS